MSHLTIQRNVILHYWKSGFSQSAVPAPMPMITKKQRQARLEWAYQHLNDDWSRTIFSDETAFCIFRNTVRVWCKSGLRPARKLPKNRQKVMARGGFSIRG